MRRFLQRGQTGEQRAGSEEDRWRGVIDPLYCRIGVVLHLTDGQIDRQTDRHRCILHNAGLGARNRLLALMIVRPAAT
jgi:hypothetical protein